ELLLDEATRWDSAFMMLNCCRTLCKPLDRFLQQFLLVKKLTPMQWHFLEDLEVILEVPHIAQQIMSSEKTPVLSHAVPAFEEMIKQWEKIAILIPH
ncbi:hypothetical protein BDR04DRAFT_956024, partial [Suillus decipiens]